MRAKVAGNLAAGPAPGAQAEKVFLNLENVKGFSDATVLQVYLQILAKPASLQRNDPSAALDCLEFRKLASPMAGMPARDCPMS